MRPATISRLSPSGRELERGNAKFVFDPLQLVATGVPSLHFERGPAAARLCQLGLFRETTALEEIMEKTRQAVAQEARRLIGEKKSSDPSEESLRQAVQLSNALRVLAELFHGVASDGTKLKELRPALGNALFVIHRRDMWATLSGRKG
ncbi:unnamed protein product, partial [Amoebophrya sp. A25]|eukprot:GSA25T00000731001.1